MNNKEYFLSIEPDLGLKESILNKIEKESKKKAVFSFILGGFTSVTSILAAIYSIVLIVKDYYVSGLSEYISLVFSDSSVVFGLWKEYIYSIVESLPFVTMTVTLVSLWIFIWSIRYMIKNLKWLSFISLKNN